LQNKLVVFCRGITLSSGYDSTITSVDHHYFKMPEYSRYLLSTPRIGNELHTIVFIRSLAAATLVENGRRPVVGDNLT